VKESIKSASLIFVSVLLIGCGGGGSGSAQTQSVSNVPTATTIKKVITVSTVPYVESLGKQSSIVASVDMGNQPKSLYILLTNGSQSETATATISHNAKVTALGKKSSPYTLLEHKKTPKILHAPVSVQAFNTREKV